MHTDEIIPELKLLEMFQPQIFNEKFLGNDLE